MLKLLSLLYAYFVDLRNKKFDRGLYPIYNCSVPVISIGNLSAGGTGKTPLTALIANFLIEKGYNPGIISRGYKGNFSGSLIVSDGKDVMCTVEQSGDEMYMLAKSIATPILVNHKKFLAAKDIASKFDLDCIIIDDGFQHRYLHRDLDIVIVDNNTLENQFTFPKGRLRESFHNISRADIVCLSGTISSNKFFTTHCKTNVLQVTIDTKIEGTISVLSTSEITNSVNVFIFSGIASHSKFRKSICDSGYTIVGEKIFSDHHRYSDADIRSIVQALNNTNTNTVITTEKDIVKLDEYLPVFRENNSNLLYLKISSFVSTNSEQFFEKILSTVRVN